jgi:hemoglobin-like flavoprotein
MTLDVRLLRGSFDSALARQPDSRLAALGAKHAGYGVTPEMYGWVGEALIATLAIANGDDWTAVHAASWAEAYATIVAMMLDGSPYQAVESPAGS